MGAWAYASSRSSGTTPAPPSCAGRWTSRCTRGTPTGRATTPPASRVPSTWWRPTSPRPCWPSMTTAPPSVTSPCAGLPVAGRWAAPRANAGLAVLAYVAVRALGLAGVALMCRRAHVDTVNYLWRYDGRWYVHVAEHGYGSALAHTSSLGVKDADL